MNSIDLRNKFFSFFISKNHTRIESSSLIPAEDPTILFTNAGMNQFKDIFLGTEKREYTRAVTIQKCVRAGGKHNDLDNVGFTKRHLTFFEMMGNFSFGGYFKKEAIAYAWEFLTKHIGLAEEILYVTVFETDDESFNIWHTEIGVPKEKIYRLGAESNFWQMGEAGPCGPCTEIFVDRGPTYGGASESPATGSERFLEIWNLVFMQYDRQMDGTLHPLKSPGVDTGMGLERLASVVQKKDSVYHTDLFYPLIQSIEQLTQQRYTEQSDELKAAFHVLADHIRSSSFLIAEGCLPSNEGRGYVLRKIIRRAALFAQKLTQKNIFPDLSSTIVKEYGTLYPELIEQQALIWQTLYTEVEKFSSNLLRGMHLLNELFTQQSEAKIISGTDAFKLYDTYGFPFEITAAAAWQKGFTVDQIGFDQAMQEQKNKSSSKTIDPLLYLQLNQNIHTEFTGYDELETTSVIIGLISNNELVPFVKAGSSCFVITAHSPFFIVGGGQVPDEGWLIIENHRIPLEQVRYIKQAIGVAITPPIDLSLQMKVTSIVDKKWRTNAMKNHTATHLLQAALMERFGKQIKQAGSLVHPDYLRFDFSVSTSLSPADIEAVEERVNEKIMENNKVMSEYMTLKEAQVKGALAFFGDKYKPEQVRVIEVPDFSVELCGGTHVNYTGDIGMFKITEISSLASGQKRIVAVTGFQAVKLFQSLHAITKKISSDYKIKITDIPSLVDKQKNEKKQLEHTLEKTYRQLFHALVPTWLTHIKMLNNVPLCIIELTDYSIVHLQEIGTLCLEKATALFFIVSKNALQEIHFFFIIAPELLSKVQIEPLVAFLKNKGLKCGVQKHIIRGGGQWSTEHTFEGLLKDFIGEKN